MTITNFSPTFILFLQFCKDSCAAQAWSVGCLLEVFYDLNRLAEEEDDLAKLALRPTDKKDVIINVSQFSEIYYCYANCDVLKLFFSCLYTYGAQ